MSTTQQRPRRLRTPAWLATVVVALLAAGAYAIPATARPQATPDAAPAAALALPTPKAFTAHLDLECFQTDVYQPPTISVFTRHINPVLANLPAETVVLGPREQLCVPVAKNNVMPPADVLPFIRYVDLSCYRIQGITVNQTLNLRHLNPQLQNLPAKNVTITTPQQLCVPVIKNGVVPPAEVMALVSYIDLKCYLTQPQTAMSGNLMLSHLNPVLTNLAPHQATVTYNRQLCVPVQKNNEQIPPEVLNIVRYIDLEKYDINTSPLATPVSLRLNHLNPSLSRLPTESVTIQYGRQLALPVAKNNLFPPG